MERKVEYSVIDIPMDIFDLTLQKIADLKQGVQDGTVDRNEILAAIDEIQEIVKQDLVKEQREAGEL